MTHFSNTHFEMLLQHYSVQLILILQRGNCVRAWHECGQVWHKSVFTNIPVKGQNGWRLNQSLLLDLTHHRWIGSQDRGPIFMKVSYWISVPLIHRLGGKS